MRLGFRTRLMLGTTLQVVAFVATAVLALAVLMDHHVAQQVAHAIDDSRKSVAMQMQMQVEALRRDAENAARSPVLLATAAIPGVDAATFADRLAEIEAPIVAVIYIVLTLVCSVALALLGRWLFRVNAKVI